MLDIQDLTFSYNPDLPPLIQNFNLQAYPGEIVLVKGASGSGKTTLLNLVCSVIPKVIKGHLQGKISINGLDLQNLTLPKISPYISILMQDPEVQLFFPNVEQELAFGPENLLIESEEIANRISYALKILEIEHLRFRDTTNLSFGEKKMVALASLITLDPNIFLLDEPTAGISSAQISILKNVIKELIRKNKIIFIAEHLVDFIDLHHKTVIMDKQI